MMSTASKSHKRALVAVFVAALCAGSTGAEVPAPPSIEAEATAPLAELPALSPVTVPRDGNPFADRLPNLVVRTHEGRNVRFYEDLIKDKIVLINFMYSTCKGR